MLWFDEKSISNSRYNFIFSSLLEEEKSLADIDCIHAPTPPSIYPVIYQKNTSEPASKDRLFNDIITDQDNHSFSGIRGLYST